MQPLFRKYTVLYSLTLFLSFFMMPYYTYAEGFLSLGDPEQVALTQAQSKGPVLLISFRVLACLPESVKDVKNAVEHVACGGGLADVVYQDKGTMREGTERSFSQSKPLTLSFTRPVVVFGKDGYVIQPKTEMQPSQTQASVQISLSKVIEKNVLASVIVTEDRVHMADVIAYFKGKEYMNPVPVPYRRVMTARQKFLLGEEHTLTGDMWVELPYNEGVESLSGEKQRLFLEMSIK